MRPVPHIVKKVSLKVARSDVKVTEITRDLAHKTTRFRSPSQISVVAKAKSQARKRSQPVHKFRSEMSVVKVTIVSQKSKLNTWLTW